MALKNSKPNPLNFFGLRRVEVSCPHFTYTILDRFNPINVKNIDKWIMNNLNNRYYIGQHLALDKNNAIVFQTKIGFEVAKDLSFFKIACPYLTKS